MCIYAFKLYYAWNNACAWCLLYYFSLPALYKLGPSEALALTAPLFTWSVKSDSCYNVPWLAAHAVRSIRFGAAQTMHSHKCDHLKILTSTFSKNGRSPRNVKMILIIYFNEYITIYIFIRTSTFIYGLKNKMQTIRILYLALARYHFFRTDTDPIPKILSICRYQSDTAQFFLNPCRISVPLCVDLFITLLCVTHNLLNIDNNIDNNKWMKM